MTGPLVSVLTPSFNQAAWLATNLASVAGQRYSAIEHVVVDGGSTDTSTEILAGHAHDRLRWVSEPDRGQSHALNKALTRSSGSIIGWLNSDDAYFDSDAIASVVRVFERRPDVDVVYGHAALVNAEGLVLHMMWVPPFHGRLLRLTNFIVQPAAFVRRSALDDAVADERYEHSMDRELWLRLSGASRFARIDRVLAIDRHQPGRKVYTRTDLARTDTARLAAAYGIPQGRAARARHKLFKVTARLLGVRLVLRGSPCFFAGPRPSRGELLLRQIARRRAAMPFGSAEVQAP